jgi:hypothetical protein
VMPRVAGAARLELLGVPQNASVPTERPVGMKMECRDHPHRPCGSDELTANSLG